MKSWVQRLWRIMIALVLIFAPVAAFAQITVTSNDVLGLLGKSHQFEDDSTGSITVNVGSAGTNQTWDFRGVVLQANQFTNQFVAPPGTPFAAQFPQANFVQKITSPSEPGAAAYIYLQVTNANLRTLGNGYVTNDTSYFDTAGTNDLAPLPFQFGATWNSTESDTLGTFPAFAISATTTSKNTVEASGLVRVPAGDFDCLRIRNDNKTVAKTIIAGVVFSTDSTTNIDYTWISKNDYLVAMVSSQDGETNPNFTNASSFGRLASVTTGVASRNDAAGLPAGFALQQNFPNPFNPETRITFQLSRAGYAELAVFNLMGERIRTLVAAPLSAGAHAVQWDGRDERGERLASGAYVYRLQADGFERSKTMLLMK